MPFRDAGRGRSDFSLNIQDCLWGVYKAMQNGLCDLNEFDVNEYEFYEKVENGDWNWITPHFVAFASPVDPAWIKTQKDKKEQTKSDALPVSPTRVCSPAKSLALQRKLPIPFMNCLEYFEQKNVKLVVRLNNELYDRTTFLERGINHLELYFDDGTNPTDEIVRRFIDVADEVIQAGGVVAVHVRSVLFLTLAFCILMLFQCKAGLGRTGTLIGAYLVWKYGFTASEAIAFMRIVRPGCVVGPQQQFMYCKQLEWCKWAAVDEMRRNHVASALATTSIVTPATPPAENEENEPMTIVPTTIITITAASPTIPPVTPSKHIAAAAAKAKSIAPPGQPRKTPNAKRVAVDSSDEEDDDTLPALGAAPPLRKLRAPSRTSTRVTASEQRPMRVTRSTAAANTAATRKPGTALSAVSTKANSQAPNKIPRLTHGSTARGTASTSASSKNPIPPVAAPATRRPQRAPSPTPSRLPTLVPSKRAHHNSVSSLGEITAATTLKIVQAATAANEWMKSNASAVVRPGNKGERPGLRNVRRRRSSFSAADVVA